MNPRFYSRIMMLFAALPLVTACEKDDTPAIDKPDDKTQLATPVVTVNVDRDAQTILSSDSYFFNPNIGSTIEYQEMQLLR